MDSQDRWFEALGYECGNRKDMVPGSHKALMSSFDEKRNLHEKQHSKMNGSDMCAEQTLECF